MYTKIKLLMWNYREAAKSSFVNYLKNRLRQYQPNICYFLETQLSVKALDRVRNMMEPMWEVHMLPSNGLYGVIVITLGQVDIINTNRQVVFGIISSTTGQSWIIAFVYARTYGIERRTL